MDTKFLKSIYICFSLYYNDSYEITASQYGIEKAVEYSNKHPSYLTYTLQTTLNEEEIHSKAK